MSNQTRIDATKLANVYIKRYASGQYANYMEMHNAILNNVVNNPYTYVSNSNMFVTFLWDRINEYIDGIF